MTVHQFFMFNDFSMTTFIFQVSVGTLLHCSLGPASMCTQPQTQLKLKKIGP